MKLPFLLSIAVLTLSSLISTVAAAAPSFPKGITILDDQHEGVYSTLWTAYPMTVESYIGTKQNIPSTMLVALTANGKMSGFRGIINVNCDNPRYSRIEGDKDSKSLDEAVADYIIPQQVVNNLARKFCM